MNYVGISLLITINPSATLSGCSKEWAPNLKNRVDEATERAVVEYTVAFPAHGQHRTSNELRKKGVFISGSGVRSIWQRHDLEKKAHDDEACGECGEIETGSQDTFYVGNLKGLGRIYQQTFVDTYSKVAHCKLYTSKTSITAADLLNDRVLPFYAALVLPMLRNTDRQGDRVLWQSGTA